MASYNPKALQSQRLALIPRTYICERALTYHSSQLKQANAVTLRPIRIRHMQLTPLRPNAWQAKMADPPLHELECT